MLTNDCNIINKAYKVHQEGTSSTQRHINISRVVIFVGVFHLWKPIFLLKNNGQKTLK